MSDETREGMRSVLVACIGLLWLTVGIGANAVPNDTDDGQASEPSFFGFGLRQLDDGREGLLVFALYPGGPAEQVGVQPGDILVAVNGVPVSVDSDLDIVNLFAEYPVGTAVVVTLLRGVTTLELSLEGASPPSEIRAQHHQVRREAESGTSGAERLWRLVNAGNVFSLKMLGVEEFELEGRDSASRLRERMRADDELLKMLMRYEPLNRAIGELQVGDHITFSIVMDHNHRIEVELREEKPMSPDP